MPQHPSSGDQPDGALLAEPAGLSQPAEATGSDAPPTEPSPSPGEPSTTTDPVNAPDVAASPSSEVAAPEAASSDVAPEPAAAAEAAPSSEPSTAEAASPEASTSESPAVSAPEVTASEAATAELAEPAVDAPAVDASAVDASAVDATDAPAAESVKLPESFDELDLPAPLRRAIERIGWTKPTPVQALSYPPLHAGHDVLVQSHTGSGKTGAFCIPWLAARFDPRPAQETGVQLLVLLPTRELAKQVCDELRRLAVEAPVEVLPIYGGTPMQPQLAALKAGVHAVVGTPGRVLDHIRRRSLDLSKVTTVVLDECDEMLSMGFLEDIRAILDACTGKHLTALFSATIPGDIQRIAKRYMHSPVEVQLSGDQVAAAEIDHAYYIVSGAIKTRDLLDLVVVEEPARAIIFCNTREETKLVASVLRREGYQAEELSSDLTQAAREKVMGLMREHKLRFLVATDVAARGIDISHVTHVINYSFPESAEVYIHRTGRTGRAGRTGTAISLIHARELGNFYYLKLQYDTIVFQERFLPPGDQLAAQRMEVKLDAISKRFPELVSPEWVLLARNLMADPRGERVIGLLLERAMKQPPPQQQAEEGERPAAEVAVGEASEPVRSDLPVRTYEPREGEERREAGRPEYRERRERRDREGRRDRDDRRDRRDRRPERDDRFARRRDDDRPRRDDERPRRDAEARPAAGVGEAAPVPPPVTAPLGDLVQSTGETGAPAAVQPAEGRWIPFDGRGRRGDRGRFVRWPQVEPGARAAATTPEGVAADVPSEPAPVLTDLVATPGETADHVGAAIPAFTSDEASERRKRRRKRRRRRGGDEAGASVVEAGAPVSEDEGDDEPAVAEAGAPAERSADVGHAEPGALPGGRKRRRKRRGRFGLEGPRPSAPPAAVAAPEAAAAPQPRRPSQEEIVIDIDEAELEVVTNEFGELDNIDEFALLDRRQAVIETLQEEVELEDVSRRDAVEAEVEVEADTESDAESEAEDEGDEAEIEAEGEAEAEPAAEQAAEQAAEGESETDVDGKKRRRRRRRKKAAPLAPPELTAPPHKDFWEVWSSKYSAGDFDDSKYGAPNLEPEPSAPSAPAAAPVAAEAAPARSPRSHAPASAPARPAASGTADADDREYTKVQLNLGRAHGHKSSSIRNLLRDHLGLEGRAIRDLTVRDVSTLFRIHDSEVDRCRSVLTAVNIEGVALVLDRAENTGEELRAPLPEEFEDAPRGEATEIRLDPLEFESVLPLAEEPGS